MHKAKIFVAAALYLAMMAAMATAAESIRIGSWVNVPQMKICPKELVNDSCPVPMPDIYAIKSEISIVDLREESGSAHSFIMIGCEASAAPVKYSLRYFSGASESGSKTVRRLGLVVDDQISRSRGAIILRSQFDPEWGTFDAELSKDQLALIRSAQRSLYLAPEGSSDGRTFPAQGTVAAINALTAACENRLQ